MIECIQNTRRIVSSYFSFLWELENFSRLYRCKTFSFLRKISFFNEELYHLERMAICASI